MHTMRHHQRGQGTRLWASLGAFLLLFVGAAAQTACGGAGEQATGSAAPTASPSTT
jgi:hypothetical protein